MTFKYAMKNLAHYLLNCNYQLCELMLVLEAGENNSLVKCLYVHLSLAKDSLEEEETPLYNFFMFEQIEQGCTVTYIELINYQPDNWEISIISYWLLMKL